MKLTYSETVTEVREYTFDIPDDIKAEDFTLEEVKRRAYENEYRVYSAEVIDETLIDRLSRVTITLTH